MCVAYARGMQLVGLPLMWNYSRGLSTLLTVSAISTEIKIQLCTGN